MAEGRSNAAIAEALVVTSRAVEKHVKSIFQKSCLTDGRHGPPPRPRRVALPGCPLEHLASEIPFRRQISDGPGRDRTCDLGIKSLLLYQLSYRPVALGWHARAEATTDARVL